MDDQVRRYDGRTEHADWCEDHAHEGLCLDVLMDWEPAPEQIPAPHIGSSSGEAR